MSSVPKLLINSAVLGNAVGLTRRKANQHRRELKNAQAKPIACALNLSSAKFPWESTTRKKHMWAVTTTCAH